jgi:hypothetical protein
LHQEAPSTSNRPGGVIFVPVIVTSAPLFAVNADPSTGAPKVQEIPRALVVSRLLPVDQIHSAWIVQENAVVDFVADAASSVERLFR